MLLRAIEPKFLLIGGIQDSRRVDKFDTVYRRFNLSGSLSLKRTQEFDVLFHLGQVYAISGCSDSAIGSVEVFDCFSGKWQEAPKLPSLLVGMNGVSFCNQLVITGGLDHTNFARSDQVFILNESEGNWTRAEGMQLKCARSHHSSVVFNNRLVIAGGTCATGSNTFHSRALPSNSVQVWNGAEWLDWVPMLQCRHQFRLVVVRGVLHAVGGDMKGLCTLLDSIERYNEAENCWEHVTTFPVKRHKCAVGVRDNKIFTFGGSDGHSNWNTYDAYDVSENSWLSMQLPASSSLSSSSEQAESQPQSQSLFSASLAFSNSKNAACDSAVIPGRDKGMTWGVCVVIPEMARPCA